MKGKNKNKKKKGLMCLVKQNLILKLQPTFISSQVKNLETRIKFFLLLLFSVMYQKFNEVYKLSKNAF